MNPPPWNALPSMTRIVVIVGAVGHPVAAASARRGGALAARTHQQHAAGRADPLGGSGACSECLDIRIGVNGRLERSAHRLAGSWFEEQRIHCGA